MTRSTRLVGLLAAAAGAGLLAAGCSDDKPGAGGVPAKGTPVFTLAWSEYPSFSAFGVAADEGLIDGEKGKQGSVERKWDVDIELKLLDYEKGVAEYTTRAADAVCVTNMDAMAPAVTRPAVAVLPTSTSAGADALVAVGVADVAELKTKKIKVHGPVASVSQYMFARILEKKYGLKDAEFEYVAMRPEEAAGALQNKNPDVRAIMTWNPFLLQTLSVRKDARVLFDSSAIPEEIIDLVVVGQDALDRPGGDRFACALADAFYQFNVQLADPAKRDDLLVKLGRRFSNLDKVQMAKACEQSRFYATPEEGIKLLTGPEFPKSMDTISRVWVERKYLKAGAPTIGFGDAESAKGIQLRFDPTYIRKVQQKK